MNKKEEIHKALKDMLHIAEYFDKDYIEIDISLLKAIIEILEPVN